MIRVKREGLPCLALIIFLFFTGNFKASRLTETEKTYHYLALGDSYTIGEALPLPENFPNQTVKLLDQAGIHFNSPRIIAKTGWTTDELEEGILIANKAEPLRSDYDLVTLLIGVNNQYRGRSLEVYKNEFEDLLKKAIAFAGNDREHVIVLSIPDWGATPFAKDSNREQIAKEISEFNKANKVITESHQVHYLDITPWTREAVNDPGLLASDGLHPSQKEYKRWAEKIAELVRSIY
jgi:lysophospholipase L1-like esterase